MTPGDYSAPEFDEPITRREALELRDAAYSTGFLDGENATRRVIANALDLVGASHTEDTEAKDQSR